MVIKTHLKLVSILSLTSILPAYAQVVNFDDYGPLQVYAQSPMQSINLSPLLRSGFSLPQGQKEWYITANAASVWSESEGLLADYYQNAISSGLKWQLSDNVLLDASYTWQFSADNHLDSLTMWFHDAFGFDQNGRKQQAKHQSQIRSTKHNINIDDFTNETLNNALNIYVGYQLLQSAHHGVSVGGTLYYKYVDSGPFADESFQQSVQVNYGYHSGNHHINSTVGVSFLHDNEPVSQRAFESYYLMLGLGYEYRTGRHGWLAEYHRYDGMVDWDKNFSEASNEAILGYRYYLNNSAIEFTMVENFLNMDNSADIAYALSYRQKF
ncbi:DUF3187 family protein [Shewanella sp. A14]